MGLLRRAGDMREEAATAQSSQPPHSLSNLELSLGRTASHERGHSWGWTTGTKPRRRRVREAAGINGQTSNIQSPLPRLSIFHFTEDAVSVEEKKVLTSTAQKQRRHTDRPILRAPPGTLCADLEPLW